MIGANVALVQASWNTRVRPQKRVSKTAFREATDQSIRIKGFRNSLEGLNQDTKAPRARPRIYSSRFFSPRG